MLIRQVIIRKTVCNKKQLDSLYNILNFDDIKLNGYIIAKCNLNAKISDIRKQIKELFDCNYEDINFKYEER